MCLVRSNYACNLVTDSQRSSLDCPQWPLSSINPTASFSAQTVNGRLFQNRSTLVFSFNFSSSAAAGINLPNPFAFVCLRPRSPTNPPATVPFTTPWYDFGNQSCFYFRLFSPPAPLQCQSILRGFVLSADSAAACGQASMADPGLVSDPPGCGASAWCRWPLQVAVGQAVAARAYFKPNVFAAANLTQAFVSIALTSSPGLPNGASVGPTVAVTFTLVSTQDSTAALLYPAFYRAVTVNATLQDLLPAPAPGAASPAPIDSIFYGACFQPAPAAVPPWCFGLSVVRPLPTVLVSQTDLPLDPACAAAGGACDTARGISDAAVANGTCGPHRSLGAGGCSPTGEVVDVRVRCAYTWTVTALDGHGLGDAKAGLQAGLYAAVLSVDPAGPAWPAGAALSPPAQGAASLSGADGPYQWPVTQQVVRCTVVAPLASPRARDDGRACADGSASPVTVTVTAPRPESPARSKLLLPLAAMRVLGLGRGRGRGRALRRIRSPR